MTQEFLRELLARAMGKRTTASSSDPQTTRSLRPGEKLVGRQVVDTRGSDSFRRSAAAARHSGKPGWLRAVEKDFDDISRDLGY